MKWFIRKCISCSRYTLKMVCPYCGSTTRIPHPAKFSPDDKYAKYRIEGTHVSNNSRTVRTIAMGFRRSK